MRIQMHLGVLLVAMAAAFSPGRLQARAVVQFSAGLEIHSAADFYDPLAANGAWVNVGSYGRCWHPARVEAGWRPYADGHWEWTDCGWYWASDEPWGWACYHYGSWIDDPGYGWVWIPGTEWAPAWVTWRQGPDYIGWAPCGPGGSVLAASFFVFADIHHFRDHLRPGSLIVNDTRVISRTKVINNITRETRDFDGTRQRVVVNRGPGVDPIQRATGAKFSPQPIREIARQTPAPETMQHSRPQPGAVEKQGPRAAQPPPALQRDRTPSEKVQPEPRPLPNQPENRRPLEPSGREQPQRNYQQPAPREPLPPVKPVEKPPLREQVVPERTPPAVPPERPLPPAAREKDYQGPAKEQPAPPQAAPPRERPPVKETPPPPPEEKNRGPERDKEQP
jgi:hypothetical protein